MTADSDWLTAALLELDFSPLMTFASEWLTAALLELDLGILVCTVGFYSLMSCRSGCFFK
jgi:hypothetical protein